MSKIEEKLKSLGIELPTPAAPVANYVGFVKSGNTVFVSGQLPIEAGKLQFIGKVGSEISAEDAKKAARICAINLLAQIKVACDGNLERVVRCVKLGIFVNGEANFKDHPAVANGASDLMVEVLGDAGKHARAAVGSSSLPFGVAVEVDAIFEIK
ncbi:MAG: RidA family protein [Pelagibacterales bacterium]|nr:RidA family protein [Pelagibacterales bacterium]